MPVKITMPALSPTMEEANLAKWLVKEGDKVSSGDVLCEIETDKATMEVEADEGGTVAKLVVPAGTEGVKVNALIAILAADGENAFDAASGGDASAKVNAERADAKAEALKQLTDKAPAAVTPTSIAKEGRRTFASPLARRLAQEASLDLSAVTGSGPHGRVLKSDVETAVAGRSAKSAAASVLASPIVPAQAPLVNGSSNEGVLKNFAEGSYELVPHDGMRKTIAKRLQDSKQTIPHFYVSVDCELDKLLALRAQINSSALVKDGTPAYKLSVNDMVIKALALALRDVPDANVSWTDSSMVKHKHADVGVAVSIPGGLITPIIRSAETKSLSVISDEMKDLGARAKARKLKPEEYQGGTTAISNMGMMGVKEFAAVVNPPHATILAIGAGEERVIVKKGQMVVANVMTVTLSTDHRAVDGALAAELLGAFKLYIESPMALLV